MHDSNTNSSGSVPGAPRSTRGLLSGREPFHASGAPLSFTLRDFWSWGASDLVGNALRGMVAEFLVHRGLGCSSCVRTEWDAVDLVAPSGARVEVKCCGYVQSWQQTKFSVPKFDIAPKRSWYAETNTYSAEAVRPADVYVFALHHHTDRATVDPLDVTQWSFYVVPTTRLNEALPTAKTIGLAGVVRLAGGPTSFEELPARIAAMRG